MLLLTTPMYPMLYIIHMPGLVATVDYTHVHNAVHYTHARSGLVATVDHTPMYTMLYIIHMPGLVATVDYTHVHNAVHYTHARSCCYC